MNLQCGSVTETECYSVYKMALLLAEGPRSRRYGSTATLRHLVQPYYC
jgi:hypothetical protein